MLWLAKFLPNVSLRSIAFASVLSVATSVVAQPLDQELLKSAGALQRFSSQPGSPVDEELGRRLADYTKQPTADHQRAVKDWIETRRQFQKTVGITGGSNTATEVKSIKRNPLYRDAGDAQDANWIQRVFDRLGQLQGPKLDSPRGDFPGLQLPSFVTPLMWALLAGLVGFFGYHVFKHVQLKQRIKRKSTSLLEEDEPERSQSEWLTLADKHEAAGEYRQAVRCLYIAMLLLFDEFRVARFDRRQTNWEHLTRIEASDAYPQDVGFRHLTQRFDRIWYGDQTQGAPDVREFRDAFNAVSVRLQGKPA